MSASRFNKVIWENQSDVLQGIMETRPDPVSSQLDISSDSLRNISELGIGDASPLLGLQLPPDATVVSRSHPSSILNTWSSYHNLSLSPRARHMNYSQYPNPRLTSDQDAWCPLQVTGVPANTTALGFRHVNKASVHDVGHYRTPSETGSQYTGFLPSDSGYESKTCTTRSVVTSSYAVDSACSPTLASHENDRLDGASATGQGPTRCRNETCDLTGDLEAPILLYEDVRRCDYPSCDWTGKCPSDKRKHQARHEKQFRCDEPNCTRKEGFGTANDLERHKKCVHKKEPERGPKKVYMCFGKNCPRRQKKWPRLDNFRQHLTRMHDDENPNELLKESDEWYEAWIKSEDVARSLADRFSRAEPNLPTQPASGLDHTSTQSDHDPCSSIAPSQTIKNPDPLPSLSESLTLNPIKNLPSDCQLQGFHVPLGPSALVDPQTVELPALKSLNLPPSSDQRPPVTPQQPDENKKAKTGDIVSDAATNLIDAMTKMMNGSQRRQSQQSDYGENAADQNSELCDKKKEILHKILTAALERLAGNSEPALTSLQPKSDLEPDKKGWVECEVCGKRTRLRCEMRKHKKRHERPYGCTFPKCNKTFGSKADWKRHENNQHYQQQSWRCTLQNPMQQNLQCARLFFQQDIYVNHLKKQHHVDEEDVKTAVWKNRIGRDRHSQFWCGFCRAIIPLKTKGQNAWDERANHIDIEHFKKGERIGDWFLPEGHATKKSEQEEEKRQNAHHTITEEEHSENGAGFQGSGCSSDGDEHCDHEPGSLQQTVRQVGTLHNNTTSQNVDAGAVDDYTTNSNGRKRKLAEQIPNRNPSLYDAEHRNFDSEKRPRKEMSMGTSDDVRGRSIEGTTASRSSTEDSQPPRQNVIYCCQCMQGPFLEYMAQCVFCPHTFCDGCPMENLPPPDD